MTTKTRNCTGVNKLKMTLAKYLYLLKKHQKACNLKFPPFRKNELKKNTKNNRNKTKQKHMEPSVSVSRKQ